MLTRQLMQLLLKCTGVLACAAILAAGPAAADGPYGSYKDGPYVREPINYWGGMYVGVGIGYSFANADLTHDYGPTDRYDIDQDGVNATVTVGFDRPLSGPFVWGLFADYTFGDIKDRVTLATPGNVDVRLRLEDSWAAGGRLGLLHDGALWYFAAGYTAMDAYFGGLGETLNGYFLGVGVEKDIHPNFRLKLEYRFSDYDTGTLFDTSCCGEIVEIESSVHSFRLGLSYVFGGAGNQGY